MNIKSLAEFKRALQIGTLVQTTFHRAFIGRGEGGKPIYGDEDKGTRPVSIVQSNSVAFKTPKGTDSWLYWEKAANYEFNGNTVSVYETDRDNNRYKILTYTIIN